MKIKRIAILAFLALFIASTASATVTVSTKMSAGPFAMGGKTKFASGTHTLSGTYTTGGFTIRGAEYGMVNLQSLMVAADSGFVSVYDTSAGKVKMYRSGAVSPSFTGTPATITTTATVASTTAGDVLYFDSGTGLLSTVSGGTLSLSGPYTPAGSVGSTSASALTEVSAGVSLTGVRIGFAATGN